MPAQISNCQQPEFFLHSPKFAYKQKNKNVVTFSRVLRLRSGSVRSPGWTLSTLPVRRAGYMLSFCFHIHVTPLVQAFTLTPRGVSAKLGRRSPHNLYTHQTGLAKLHADKKCGTRFSGSSHTHVQMHSRAHKTKQLLRTQV